MDHDTNPTTALLSGTKDEPDEPSKYGTCVKGYDGNPSVQYEDRIDATSTSPVEVQVYPKRFYVLLVFSLTCFTQGMIWNTWGAISAVSEDAFGWKNSDIALLTNWGPIAYVVAMFFFSWMMDVKGLRWAVVLCAGLLAAGAGLRCITSEAPYVSWLVHAGQFLNGLGGPVVMGGPPVVSAVWFPPNQRTTSTAISVMFGQLGVAVSFVLGPYIVHGAPKNGSSHNTSWDAIPHEDYNNNRTNVTLGDMERKEIMELMYIECGWAIFVFLLVLIYFPARPPKPPSVSASMERKNFKEGLSALVRNVKFWLIGATYALSLGVNACWASVLDVNLKPHGISQNEAGWLGFYSAIVASLMSLGLARFADIFSRHMRLFLLILYVLAAGSFLWFGLMADGVLPLSLTLVYVSVISGSIFLNATVPLFYELVCETTYPVAEGITNGVLTLLNNIAGLVFLFVLMIPNIGTVWMNWFLIASIVSCVPVLFAIKENYNRLEVDESTGANSPKSEVKRDLRL